jgi:hypothetical protein
MFWHQGAILREFINNKESNVQYLFQALITLTSIIKIKITFQIAHIDKYKSILLQQHNIAKTLLCFTFTAVYTLWAVQTNICTNI